MDTVERDTLPLDTVYEVLSNRLRRDALFFLALHDRPLMLNDLTKEIVVRRENASITEISGEKLHRVATALYHRHVPKLAAAGVVTFDSDRRLVEPTEKMAFVVSYLPPELEREIASESPPKLQR